MEIRDFMTKENLEMIGLAVMCDRGSYLWSGYSVREHGGIKVINSLKASTSFDNFTRMINLGKDITVIMKFFENLDGECKIKDVSKYLEEKNTLLSMQRITAVCRRLCASGYLKQRYSDPYKITVKVDEWEWSDFLKRTIRKEVTKEIEVKDSLYSLA